MSDEARSIEVLSAHLLRLCILTEDRAAIQLLTNCSTDLQQRARELRTNGGRTRGPIPNSEVQIPGRAA